MPRLKITRIDRPFNPDARKRAGSFPHQAYLRTLALIQTLRQA
jgi:hypothetical protein